MIKTEQEWFTPEERIPNNNKRVHIVIDDTGIPFEATYYKETNAWYLSKMQMHLPTSHIKLWAYPALPKEGTND